VAGNHRPADAGGVGSAFAGFGVLYVAGYSVGVQSVPVTDGELYRAGGGVVGVGGFQGVWAGGVSGAVAAGGLGADYAFRIG